MIPMELKQNYGQENHMDKMDLIGSNYVKVALLNEIIFHCWTVAIF